MGTIASVFVYTSAIVGGVYVSTYVISMFYDFVRWCIQPEK